MWFFLRKWIWGITGRNSLPRFKGLSCLHFSLSMRGLCLDLPVQYYWYLATNDQHEIFYEGFMGDKIYPSGDFRTWTWAKTNDAGNSQNYKMSITLSGGPGITIGDNIWYVSDSSCNSISKIKTELIFSLCLLGSDFICDNGECISKYKRWDGVFDCQDHSDEASCKAIKIDQFYDKGSFDG